MPLKAVLFDLWGTLFFPSVSLEEYVRYRAKLLHEGLKKRGFNFNEKEVYEALTRSREICDVIREVTLREVTVEMEVMMFLKEISVPISRINKDMITYLSDIYMKPYLTLTKPVKGLTKLFRAITNMGIKVAIVSNTMKGSATRELIKKHGLERYISAYALSDEVCYRKPHPIIFNIALKELQTPPSQALMVGDEECDMKGASKLGIKTALFSGFKKQEYKGKYREVSNVDQLVSLIRKLSL